MDTKIQLIETPDQHIKKQIKRPSKLDLGGINPHRNKWEECKIYGKNILIRSYAGACIISTELYVYGGLQILNGILADFHKINIRSEEMVLKWEPVEVKNEQESPGPRAKHALIAYQTKIYLIGGIKTLNHVSNEILVYDTKNYTWTKLSPEGDKLPPIQTFGCVLVNKKNPQIITMCGYDGQLCQSTNAVYSYDILSNRLNTLFSHTNEKGTFPISRMGCGIVFNQEHKLFLFGGKSELKQQRLNDFWEFNLNTNKFTEINQDSISKPIGRNGHTMTFYQGKIFLYGGIHDITWQLDDLHIYDLHTKQWIVLETDSARKKKEVSIRKNSSAVQNKEKNENATGQKRKMSQTTVNPNLYMKKKSIVVQAAETASPTKTIDQLKHKAFLQKKSQMLKNFQVKEEQKSKLLSMQPSSQAMMNSLDLIGSGLIPNDSPSTKSKKLQLSKTTYSKFLQPLVITNHFVPGKKPCARDGHNAVLLDKEIIFFGGDRHHMSFNDIYVLHLDAVIKDAFKV